MSAAIAADQNLSEIFDELRALSAEPGENAERLIQLTKFWSGYLDGEGAPYLVQSNVVSSSSNTFFYLKSYEVRRDLTLSIGAADTSGLAANTPEADAQHYLEEAADRALYQAKNEGRACVRGSSHSKIR